MTSRALVFTDVVDSTRIVSRLGDERSAAIWAEHDRLARDLTARHEGREIDRSDGFFLIFDRVPDAARWALHYHAAVAGLGLRVRVGIHAETVSLRENPPGDVARGAKPLEVEGLAKPMAARIMSLASGGQTLLSAAAHAALESDRPCGVEIENHGHYRLKGVEEPAELFEIGIAGSPFAPPGDADKAYRVVQQGGLWRPVREIRHNLPPERDAFIGRSADLLDLSRRLDAGARQLTLLGPGGTGKTRLARRYGLAWLGDWPGGVYFCDLSEARSVDGICFAVALGLGVPLGKDEPVAQLGNAIAGRGRCLILLDNFEQVVAHAAATLGRWLDAGVEAAFVVTSRERLQLHGEEVLPVEPLPMATDAVDLFVVRARARRPGFEPDPPQRRAIADIVRLLDGLPLAIELAAARVGVLSPAQIVERMKDRFGLLVGARGAAARQATMKAAIDWSWDLLEPWEQAALAQCAAFEGGFTLGAAEAVLDLVPWAEAPPLLDVVQALVDKSLLRSWTSTGTHRFDLDEPYFGMYLSIHEYARARLCGSPGARIAAERRHGDHYAAFGSDAAIRLLSVRGGNARLAGLTWEIDNLVSACRRAVADPRPEVAVHALAAASQVLGLRGPYALVVDLSLQVLAMDPLEDRWRARALVTRGVASWQCGLVDAAAGALDQAMVLADVAGDDDTVALALAQRGWVHYLQGDMAAGTDSLERGLLRMRASGDRQREGWALGRLASVLEAAGQTERALQAFDAAIALQREVGDVQSEATARANLGMMLMNQGHFARGSETLQQVLALVHDTGHRGLETVVRLNLGNAAGEQGRFDDALQHYGAALALARDTGSRRFEAGALTNLGYLHQLRGHADAARDAYGQALAMHRAAGDRRLVATVLGNLGDLHLAQGRLEEAMGHAQQALALHRELGHGRMEGVTLVSLADVHLALGSLEPALAAVDAGEILLREAHDDLELGKLSCVRGRVHVALRQRSQALHQLDEARRIADHVAATPESALGQAITRLHELIAET